MFYLEASHQGYLQGSDEVHWIAGSCAVNPRAMMHRDLFIIAVWTNFRSGLALK
jgi:hypothetical protein